MGNTGLLQIATPVVSTAARPVHNDARWALVTSVAYNSFTNSLEPRYSWPMGQRHPHLTSWELVRHAEP